MRNNLKENLKAINNIVESPQPSLAVDLDGVITDCPIFFSVLTHNWKGKVYVITYRDSYQHAEESCKEFNIAYDEIILVNSFEEKAKIIAEKGILVYFDDQPEVLKHIPSTVNVMLVRNGGNYDYESRKWIFSKHTGQILE